MTHTASLCLKITLATLVLAMTLQPSLASCPGFSGEDLDRCNCRELDVLPDSGDRNCSSVSDCVAISSRCGDWVALAIRAKDSFVKRSEPRKFSTSTQKPDVFCLNNQCMLEEEYKWKKE